MRTGVRPDGRQLAPVMPWHAYGNMTDQDAQALASYIKAMKPMKNKVPPLSGPTEKAPGPYMTVVVPQ